jgi:hypothetical protein
MTATATATASSNGFLLCLITSATSTRAEFNSLATSVHLWGAQLVKGSSALTYQKTVDRLDIPRIDYTGGGCPSILLEPQRTNLCAPSNNKNNVSAGQIEGTYVADTSISAPDNSTSAYKFTPTDLGSSLAGAASSGNRFYFELAGSNTTYTNSVYVKSVSGSSFDFAIKVVNRDSDTEIASTTINVNNSWQRVSVTGLTTGASTGQRFVIKSEQAVYLWGFQIEAGAYPTSYIPTTTASVTRNADVISKTGISDLLNPSEGTFYAEISALVNDLTFRSLSLSDGTGNSVVQIAFTSVSNQIRFDISGQGATYRSNVTVLDITENHKVLIKWGPSGIFGFIDGDKYTFFLAAGTGSGIPAALNRINFSVWWGGGNFFYGKCKGVQIYKTALSDPQCQALTTL